MDQFSRHYFGMIFRERFVDARGDEFQKLFGRIMNVRYRGDFTQTRPWGPLGDDKCDGYLPSQRKFFQCYAPDDLAQAATLKKLKEDFEGALPNAGRHFDTWVFAHNAHDGRVPSWLTLELDRLRQAHPNITIETLGYWELHHEALQLDQGQLVDLFGPFPSLRDLLSVQFEDVRPLLDYVARQSAPVDTPPRLVPPTKLVYNRLSEDVEYCLRSGMIKAAVVRDYLDGTPDKELGARVTSAFRAEYDRLKQEESDPDRIFYGLRVFAQGQFVQAPRTEGAVLAMLAYLFEECDIFERPPDAPQP
jgi:hypothetical protein